MTTAQVCGWCLMLHSMASDGGSNNVQPQSLKILLSRSSLYMQGIHNVLFCPCMETDFPRTQEGAIFVVYAPFPNKCCFAHIQWFSKESINDRKQRIYVRMTDTVK